MLFVMLEIHCNHSGFILFLGSCNLEIINCLEIGKVVTISYERSQGLERAGLVHHATLSLHTLNHCLGADLFFSRVSSICNCFSRTPMFALVAASLCLVWVHLSLATWLGLVLFLPHDRMPCIGCVLI